MALAAATVGHGGFGTTMLSLAAGVPLVVIPLFALDQHHNAAAVARRGAGVKLDRSPEVGGEIGAAVRSLLGSPSYREAARQTAHEMTQLPPVAEAVPILVELSQT
jgi:UDP:flavonoid glycosyltransferase YjiC (YdhE family)